MTALVHIYVYRPCRAYQYSPVSNLIHNLELPIVKTLCDEICVVVRGGEALC